MPCKKTSQPVTISIFIILLAITRYAGTLLVDTTMHMDKTGEFKVTP